MAPIPYKVVPHGPAYEHGARKANTKPDRGEQRRFLEDEPDDTMST
jgi:hypothetical protein